jgi:Rhodopirellula transposase DDE domain
VRVGIDHDTAEFAAEAIRCWWRKMGSTPISRAISPTVIPYRRASKVRISINRRSSKGSSGMV